MENGPRLSGWKVAWLSVALAALACNLPLPLVAFTQSGGSQETPDEFAYDLVQRLQATLVNEDERVLPLDAVHATTWRCRDVDGEASRLRRDSEAMAMRKVLRTDFDLRLEYFEDDEALRIGYSYDFALVDPVVDGVTGEVVDWDTQQWSGDATPDPFRITDQGTFSGHFTVDERREGSYPKRVVSTVEENHNFFGLIPQRDFQTAYYCDLGNIPVPSGLEVLTSQDFSSHCAGYYYECDAG